MKIENIVSSGSFNQSLDLAQLSSSCPHIEYKKNRYHGAYIKFGGYSVTIYRTGKYIMPGLKSLDDIEKVFDKIKEILSPYADTALFTHPEIRNIVCSSQTPYELNLNTLYLELISRDIDATYEPEAFPGMILKTPDCTYNVFSSGKFLILGCTSIPQAEDAEKYIIKLICDL